MLELSLHIPTGLCPRCEAVGAVGQLCLGPGCVRQGVAFVPAESARQALSVAPGDREGLIGQFIGDYLIIDRLGKGGFGRVLLGLQRPLYRLRAAVKLLEFNDPDASVLETVRQKFEREAASLAVLESPHVVRLLQYGLFEERPFMAMEFIPGGRTLRSLLNSPGAPIQPRPPLGEIKRIIEQILLGLEAAHQRGIIHRDIKPENIMLHAVVGDPTFVKIVDFGLAKLLSSSHETSHVFGTIHYMAPEQVAQRDAGPWTDLFAVAIIAFELLLGRRPYSATDVQAVLLEKLNPNFDPTATLTPGELATPGVSFFRRSLAPAPENRFRSTSEFMAAWRHLIDSMVGRSAGQPGQTRLGNAVRPAANLGTSKFSELSKDGAARRSPQTSLARETPEDKTHERPNPPPADPFAMKRNRPESDRALRSTVLEMPVAGTDSAPFQTGMPLGLVMPRQSDAKPAKRSRRNLGLAIVLGAIVASTVGLVIAGLSVKQPTEADTTAAAKTDEVNSVAEGTLHAPPAIEPQDTGAITVAGAAPFAAEVAPPAADVEPALELEPAIVETATKVAPLHISIRTRPVGAKLVLDGLDVGLSPLDLETKVGAGHVVIAKADGYIDTETSFVAALDMAPIEITLKARAPAPTSQTIATPPKNGAMVHKPTVEDRPPPPREPPVTRKPAPLTPIYIDD